MDRGLAIFAALILAWLTVMLSDRLRVARGRQKVIAALGLAFTIGFTTYFVLVATVGQYAG